VEPRLPSRKPREAWPRRTDAGTDGPVKGTEESRRILAARKHVIPPSASLGQMPTFNDTLPRIIVRPLVGRDGSVKSSGALVTYAPDTGIVGEIVPGVPSIRLRIYISSKASNCKRDQSRSLCSAINLLHGCRHAEVRELFLHGSVIAAI